MPAVTETLDTVQALTQSGYKWGFETDIETEFAPVGLTEETVRLISTRKNEPAWLLEWRLVAFAAWQKMEEPDWASVTHPPIDYQALHYYAAPMRDENQLHAAVVELVALDDARIKYSTVQNWYPGDAQGRGGIYNFVTKRGACRGARSKISWTQVETGSAITWKYPSCVLIGDDSVGEFYSVAVTNNHQQADTGTKMIHLGRNTRSTIVAKGISAGQSQNTYRGLVRMASGAAGARNHTQCDSLLIGDRCGAHTVPYIESRNPTAKVEHEATTSKIADDQLFYCRSRGLSEEDAVSLIVNGFCKEVLKELPMEFAVEAQKLLAVSLEGSVG